MENQEDYFPGKTITTDDDIYMRDIFEVEQARLEVAEEPAE